MLAELFTNSPQQINTEIIAHKRLQPCLDSRFKIKQHLALLGLKLLTLPSHTFHLSALSY